MSTTCWIPLNQTYQKMTQLLNSFLEANIGEENGFYQIRWDTNCMPKEIGQLEIENVKLQGATIYAKWVVKVMMEMRLGRCLSRPTI